MKPALRVVPVQHSIFRAHFRGQVVDGVRLTDTPRLLSGDAWRRVRIHLIFLDTRLHLPLLTLHKH